MIQTVDEIMQLKAYLRQLAGEGTCPPRNALDHLFEGRATEYLDIMNQLGQVDIRDGVVYL